MTLAGFFLTAAVLLLVFAILLALGGMWDD